MDGATQFPRSSCTEEASHPAAQACSAAAVDHADREGRTPLLVACCHGRAALATLLVAARAEVGQASIDGRTPLYAAAENGNLEVVRQVLSAQVRPPISGWSAAAFIIAWVVTPSPIFGIWLLKFGLHHTRQGVASIQTKQSTEKMSLVQMTGGGVFSLKFGFCCLLKFALLFKFSGIFIHHS